MMASKIQYELKYNSCTQTNDSINTLASISRLFCVSCDALSVSQTGFTATAQPSSGICKITRPMIQTAVYNV